MMSWIENGPRQATLGLALVSLLLLCPGRLLAGERAVVLMVASDPFSRAMAARFEHAGNSRLKREKSLQVVSAEVVSGGEKPKQHAARLAAARADLKRGVRAYENLEPAEAVTQLRAAATKFERIPGLLASAQRSEYLTALTYLGASQVLDGDAETGAATFRRLLVLARATKLDKRLFPPGLVKLFEAARSDVAALPSGSMSLFTTPGHGKVFVDGVFRGVAPCTVEGLPEGRHLVTITKDGYRSTGKVVHVEAAAEASVNVQLKPTRGTEALQAALGASAATLPDGVAPALLAMLKKARVDRLLIGRLQEQDRRVAYEVALIDVKQGQKIRSHGGLIQPDAPNFAKAVDGLFSYLITGRSDVLESLAKATVASGAAGSPGAAAGLAGPGPGGPFGGSDYEVVEAPLYERWYFWTAIGVGAAAVLAVALGVTLSDDPARPGSQILLEF